MTCVAILLAWLAIAAAIVALIWRNAANKRAFEALREADRRAAYWKAMFEQKPGEASDETMGQGGQRSASME